MKKSIAAILLILPLAACNQTQQGAAVGAGLGAAGGAIVGGTDGAIVGGLGGAAAGALIGRAQEDRNQCQYRDRNGNIYTASCPSGY